MSNGIWYAMEARNTGHFWVVDVYRVDEGDSTKRVKIGEAPGVRLRDAFFEAALIAEGD